MQPPISLVVVNARIRTGMARRPWADALAVRGDRLAAVGSSAEIRKLAGSTARVVDARGGLLVPRASGEEPAVLAAGGRADFTLLEPDPTHTPHPSPSAMRVVLTVEGGVEAPGRPLPDPAPGQRDQG